MTYLHHTSFGIGLLGVLVIVFGVAGGLVRFMHAKLPRRAGAMLTTPKRLRRDTGYYLLLGLEFLIAADIIDTLMEAQRAGFARAWRHRHPHRHRLFAECRN